MRKLMLETFEDRANPSLVTVTGAPHFLVPLEFPGGHQFHWSSETATFVKVFDKLDADNAFIFPKNAPHDAIIVLHFNGKKEMLAEPEAPLDLTKLFTPGGGLGSLISEPDPNRIIIARDMKDRDGSEIEPEIVEHFFGQALVKELSGTQLLGGLGSFGSLFGGSSAPATDSPANLFGSLGLSGFDDVISMPASTPSTPPVTSDLPELIPGFGFGDAISSLPPSAQITPPANDPPVTLPGIGDLNTQLTLPPIMSAPPDAAEPAQQPAISLPAFTIPSSLAENPAGTLESLTVGIKL